MSQINTDSRTDAQHESVPAPVRQFADAIRCNVAQATGTSPSDATLDAWMRAAAHACRAPLAERWAATQMADRAQSARRVHYLSMEFLMGRALTNALAAFGLADEFAAACTASGKHAADVLERETDAALGNGGLGRLAACFLDSMATLGLPAFGYGLRYEFGMFRQRILDGRQVEEPDDWLRDGNPWEVLRPEVRYRIGFGGRVDNDCGTRRWAPSEVVAARACDFIVPGHGTERVATLRLWQAAPAQPIDFAAFGRGDHAAAGQDRLEAEALNWLLYPDDSTLSGRALRLRQEYLLVSASLQDIVARHLRERGGLHDFGAHAVVHLNDTHPALAVPELMRLLHDEHGLAWNDAWAQCRAAVSYTNHTLMPEALETWPVHMLEVMLPRHLEIIYEINAQFLGEVRARVPGDEALVRRVSIIEENGERRVRMAALSIVASHRVNGVSKLHSDLMVNTIFADYARLFPDRFLNVTNGITPRRWLALANPSLAQVIDAQIGPQWRTDLDRLAALADHARDPVLRAAITTAKRRNKERLASLIRRELGITVDPASLFDVQIKRIHEYKRQLLNVLQVVARYQAIVAAPEAEWTPRTVIFAGKAASAYARAKTIIHLIHDVARIVNTDPRVGDKLRVVFVPNYGVSLAEIIIPAADLSEQISTAGTEASGTGNMKFALNGALTIGTWDGANIEMAEAIGAERMFIFGLRADEVARMKALGYDPRLYYDEQLPLRAALDAIGSGRFSPGEPTRYRELVDSLLVRDTYMLCADFAAYVEAQARVDRAFADRDTWTTSAIRNIAAMGGFSSDRTIRDYARDVWRMPI